MKFFLLLSFASAAFNTGLIWVIQLVHYPGFLKVDRSTYAGYQSFHMSSITPLVGPSMLLELAMSTGLLFYWDQLPGKTLIGISLGLLLLIWLHTGLLAAPLHGRLLDTPDTSLIQRLISLNWWRTVFWTSRMLILGYLIWKLLA